MFFFNLILNTLGFCTLQSCILTSHNNGGGLLRRVSHIVAGHAAVHPRLVWGDGGQRERTPLHHAPLRQAVITAEPGEYGGRLPTCGDAHQRYRLARIDHDGILHQQLDGWGGWGGGEEEWLAEDGHLGSYHNYSITLLRKSAALHPTFSTFMKAALCIVGWSFGFTMSSFQ